MAKKDVAPERDWSEPLTDDEKEIIAKILETGDMGDLCKWLDQTTKIAEGLAEKLQKQSNCENALRELAKAVDSEVLEYWRMGGYRQPDQDADAVINAVKNAQAALNV